MAEESAPLAVLSHVNPYTSADTDTTLQPIVLSVDRMRTLFGALSLVHANSRTAAAKPRCQKK